jgi:DNA (cytosine-5)-methyltransferase 1
MLTHVSLFSGIGGIDLAAEQAGFQTVCFVEKDEYCQKVLRKRWPDVPIINDVRSIDEIKKEVVAYAESKQSSCNERQYSESQQKQFRGGSSQRRVYAGNTENKQPITLISGGFPCQPASVAGKRRGTTDDRWLWPEAFRVVAEIKPTWCLFENVNGILTLEQGMGFDNLLSDLENEGYEVQSYIIPACGVNAPHRRYRVFIVAHANKQGLQGHRGLQECTEELLAGQGSESIKGNWEFEPDFCRVFNELSYRVDGHWFDRESDVPRVATGVKNRVQRLKALGNAVVPAQVYPILKAIAEIENGKR